jgi:predicted dehydrogenase
VLKVAIVGCGKIADAHASQISRIKGCEIVGVCDREVLMAQQLRQRFPVKGHYAVLEQLLDESRPDVVHITTPPQSHFDIAKTCLEYGAHVYVEKPFTLNAPEADALIRLANTHGLKITAGHDDQFTHVARRMRQLIQDGYLGGRPLHMESIYCYDLSQAGYAKALLGDKHHWVRGLPGKLLQNVISHGIARIAEHMTSDAPQVMAHGFVSSALKNAGEDDIVDELRVIIADEGDATAYFTFSSQMRPSLHEFRIFGRSNGLILDHDQDLLIKLRGRRFPSYAEKFLPHLNLARQHLGNFGVNFRTFLARDFHMKSGMKYLMESFYRSITDGAPLAISYREIVLTARIMDSIFDQISDDRRAAPDSMPQYSRKIELSTAKGAVR